jgi:hypothetical protein
MFAHAGVTKVAAHDLITERLLSKRRQTFKELNKDGDGYLTKEELEGHRDWLQELGKGDLHSPERGALQHEGIQKEDIDKLLDKEADLDGDGKISFDEFVHVGAGGLEFTAGEAVQVRGGGNRYTTAEVVRREDDCYIVRTFAFRAWQPSWFLAKLLVDGMMLPALVLSAAQQLVVVLKNSSRRGYEMGGDKDDHYEGPMVFMDTEEKARHVLCKTKYLWLWQYVPFATPLKKGIWCRDYGYVTTSTVSRFAQDNPGVKILHLSGCWNIGADGIADVGTNCSALKALKMESCGLKGTA